MADAQQCEGLRRVGFSLAEVLEEFEEAALVAPPRHDFWIAHWRRRREDPILRRIRTKAILREIDRDLRRKRKARRGYRNNSKLVRGWAVMITVVCPCCGSLNHIHEGAMSPHSGWCCESHPRAPGDHG